MKKVAEADKKFISVFMHPDSAKEDLLYLKNNCCFKAKVSYVTAIMLGISIFLILFGASISYMLLPVGLSAIGVGLILVIISTIFLRKVDTKKKLLFLNEYEKAIVENCQNKYPNYYPISALYPIYLFFDNDEKVIKMIYQDKEYLYFEYSDVANYRILVDKEVLQNRSRLPENPNRKYSSYIIEISFKNKKRAQIGFNNTCSKFILGGKYDYQQFVNTNSINSIARILDCILKKNEVDPNKIKTDTE